MVNMKSFARLAFCIFHFKASSCVTNSLGESFNLEHKFNVSEVTKKTSVSLWTKNQILEIITRQCVVIQNCLTPSKTMSNSSLASRLAEARAGSNHLIEPEAEFYPPKNSVHRISSTDSSSFFRPRDLTKNQKSSKAFSRTTTSNDPTGSARDTTSTTSCYSGFSNSTPAPVTDLRINVSSDRSSGSAVESSSGTIQHRKADLQKRAIRSCNLNEPSSNSSSVTVSRGCGLVTPNICSSSGHPSSHTKSSTTPQTSASAKVVAVVEGRGAARGEIGMAYIDLRNPLLVLSQFADTQAYVRLAVQLNILRPIEVILPHTVMEARSKIISRIREMFPEIGTVTVPRKSFNETKGLQCIQDLCVLEYKAVELEVASKYYCLAACSALIKYVEFKQSMSYASHSLRIVYRTTADTTMISTSTARHLELVTNELGKTDHTLYGVLNYTLTPGGDRMLRSNILQPPCDVITINTRLDCIAELMDNEDLFNDLKSVVGKFLDTEHMLSLCIQIHKEKNIRNSEQKIANVISLKHSLDLVKPFRNYLSNAKNALFQTYYQALSDERFQELQEKISLVIHKDARWQKGTLNMHMQKCFAVKSNINGLLDIARRAYSESVNDVSDIVKQLEKQYGIPLNLGYNTLRGFFIQIHIKTIPSIEKLPSVFIKVNKYKSTVSCTTEDLIKLNDRIRESLNEIYLMSDIIIDEVISEIRENIGCLYSLTEAVSSVDFLVSLTHACTLSNHVRPEFSNVFAVKSGRHPVIEKIIHTTYIPNDTFLCEEINFIILSGANMSGKTTYLKQVAVLQIMAQIGCYVPAEYACFRIAQQILTRMGSSSDIEKNYSTFMLQMKEVNFILQQATEKSLIIMDEVGKGTNIEEGCSLAYAICEQLLTKKAFNIFSTHFMEVTELSSVYPNVEKVDYDLNENEGCVCNFSHELTQGPCKEGHYGIKIAELSTLPKSVIEDAKNIIQNSSETKRREYVSEGIDEEMREKIKFSIHLIHLSQNEVLEEEELINHLRNLKAQYVSSLVSEESDISPSTF